jgi:tape measure domain-containing protein
MSAEVSLGWNNAKLQAGARGAAAIVTRASNQMQATMNRMKGFSIQDLMVGGATLGFGKMALDIVVGTDRMTRAMTTLEGSSEAAQRRLADLREVAKLPGIGFEQAVAGDVRLRAVGISADVSKQALIEFGNALALAGGTASDLDGVILALGQIASKGKVSAEEINQIAERVPQIRKVMMDVFGTADTEAIQKMNISAEEFITQTIAGFSRLDRATAGLDESLSDIGQNFRESINAIAGPIVNEAVPAFAMLQQSIADNKGGLEEFGKVSAGVFTSLIAMMEAASVIGFAATGKMMGDERGFMDIVNDRYNEIKPKDAPPPAPAGGKPAEGGSAATKPSPPVSAEATKEQREAAAEARRIEEERLRLAEKQFNVWMSHQTPLLQIEALQKRIQELQAQAAGRDGPVHELARLKIEQEILEMKERQRDIQNQAAEDSKREQQAMDDKAKKADDIARGREEELARLDAELAILDAQNSGNDKKAKALQRAKDIAEETLRIMEATGLSEAEAAQRAAALVDGRNKQREGDDPKKRGRIKGYSRKQEDIDKEWSLDAYKERQKTPLKDTFKFPGLDAMNARNVKTIAPAPAANGKPTGAMEMPTLEDLMKQNIAAIEALKEN